MNKKICKHLKIIPLIVFGLAIVYFFHKIAPYDEDEFIYYFPLICHMHRNTPLDTLACQNYALNVWNTGLILPLRALPYVGSFPSLYYYPLYMIWRNPMSSRFLGIIFLLIQAITLSKIFNTKVEYMFIGLISFLPYLFVHIVHTGPVVFQTTSIYLIYYLTKKWAKKPKIKYALSISVIIFLGVWTKVTYFWLLPGIAFILSTNIIWGFKRTANRGYLKKLLIHSTISITTLIILSSLLLLSTDTRNPDYYPYIDLLLNSEYTSVYTISELLDTVILRKSGVFNSIINPFAATLFVYNVRQPEPIVYAYDLFIYSSTPLLCILLVIVSKKRVGKQVVESMILFFVFIFTLLLILLTKTACMIHHTILAFPFFILSFLIVVEFFCKLENRFITLLTPHLIAILWLISFILFNAHLFRLLLNQPLNHPEGFSKERVNRILNDEYLSKNYFYVVSDYGMFFYQGLYGNEFQNLVYGERLNNDLDIIGIKEWSRLSNKKFLFIHAPYFRDVVGSTNHSLLHKHFTLKPCDLISDKTAWNIMLEPDNSSENICFQKNGYNK